MITETEPCPVCGRDTAGESALVDHLLTHATTLTPPDPKVIAEKIEKVIAATGHIHAGVAADGVMFEVEHLIANEWGPMTHGTRVDVNLNGYVAESWPTILGIMGLAALDRVLEQRDTDAYARDPNMLRVEVKVSPLWLDPEEGGES